MGSNRTQAMAVVLFLLGFVFMAMGAAGFGGIISFVIGLALVAGSIALFLKAKPWENQES